MHFRGWSLKSKLDSRIADELEAIFRAPLLECYSTSETSRIFSNPMPPAKRKRGTADMQGLFE